MLTNLLIRFQMDFIFLFYSLPSNSRFKYSYWFLGRALINMKFNFIPWPSKSLRFLTYHHFVKFYKRLLFWMKSNCKLKIQKQKLEKNLRECKIQNHSKRTRKGLNTRKKQFLRCYITKSWWHYFFNISIDNLLCCNNSFL